jgi:hypothetical protein
LSHFQAKSRREARDEEIGCRTRINIFSGKVVGQDMKKTLLFFIAFLSLFCLC